MAINSPSQYSPEPFMRTSSARRDKRRPWHLQLGVGQLVILWSFVAGMMVAVFVFGLYAGREQGFKQALDEQGQLAMRLPIPRAESPEAQPVPGPEIVAAAELSAPPSPAEQPLAAIPAPTFAALDTELNRVEELSKQVKEEMGALSRSTEPSVGFMAKPADGAGAAPADAPAKPGINRMAEQSRLAMLEPKPETAAPTATAVSRSAAPAAESSKAKSEPKPDRDAVSARAMLKESRDEAPPATKSVSPKKEEPSVKIARGWHVQIAAAKTKSEANAILRRARSKGFSAQIEQATVRGTTYHRVLVGPYPSKKAAQASQKKITRAKLGRGTSFVRKVG